MAVGRSDLPSHAGTAAPGPSTSGDPRSWHGSNLPAATLTPGEISPLISNLIRRKGTDKKTRWLQSETTRVR